MEQVEHVARSKNCDAVALSCRQERKGAREFYKRIGYDVNSTSKVFFEETRVVAILHQITAQCPVCTENFNRID
jgi:hypothetical protein